ncbi:ATP-binding protein [Pseudobdellovibrio sp. HCB154]|uniref:ATP/GTP-binding protein n=1 Tax=Pseudobdellovibrio sp. HCB154 TaxID=3386277 RepID=UPI0039173DE2
MAKKLAITGGPSGGKTTLIEVLKQEFGPKIKVAPEAASILYKGGFPRVKNYAGYYHAQLAIISTLRHIEDLLVESHPECLIICDRGSLDSLAYWPDNEEHFFKNINSTRQTELARYDWVLHLDTATEGDYDTTNPIRTESFHEALLLNEKVRSSWNGHPRRQIITAENDFFGKMKKATDIVEEILSQMSLNKK